MNFEEIYETSVISHESSIVVWTFTQSDERGTASYDVFVTFIRRLEPSYNNANKATFVDMMDSV